MVRYVLLLPLRPELDVSWSNILCPTFLFTSVVLLYVVPISPHCHDFFFKKKNIKKINQKYQKAKKAKIPKKINNQKK
jgi:hypothetical protein